MAKGAKKTKLSAAGSASPGVAAANEQPVIDLRMDSSTPEAPREVAATASFSTPCTLQGCMAGLSGGALGYVFGFGGYWMRNIRGGGHWKASLESGWSSARTFAIMGGLYAAVSCFMQRLRQKNDAWNGAASGCATGLALGWKQGPVGALQNCALLGAFSFFADGMGGGPAEAAEQRSPTAGGCRGPGSAWWEQGQQRPSPHLLLLPAMPLLAALAPCGSGGGEGGCRVLRGR